MALTMSSNPDPRLSRKQPPNGPARAGKTSGAPGPAAPSLGQALALPHERDEAASSVADTPDPKIEQAKRDIDRGLVDTDMHATPGLDAELRKKLVPGPGGKAP